MMHWLSFALGVAFWALVDLLIEGWHWRRERRECGFLRGERIDEWADPDSCWKDPGEPPEDIHRFKPGDIIEPKDVLYYEFYDETEHRN